MTIHEIRHHERLRSEDERQAHDAIARARRAELEREEAAARRALRWMLVIGLALALVLIAIGLRGLR